MGLSSYFKMAFLVGITFTRPVRETIGRVISPAVSGKGRLMFLILSKMALLFGGSICRLRWSPKPTRSHHGALEELTVF